MKLEESSLTRKKHEKNERIRILYVNVVFYEIADILHRWVKFWNKAIKIYFYNSIKLKFIFLVLFFI